MSSHTFRAARATLRRIALVSALASTMFGAGCLTTGAAGRAVYQQAAYEQAALVAALGRRSDFLAACHSILFPDSQPERLIMASGATLQTLVLTRQRVQATCQHPVNDELLWATTTHLIHQYEHSVSPAAVLAGDTGFVRSPPTRAFIANRVVVDSLREAICGDSTLNLLVEVRNGQTAVSIDYAYVLVHSVLTAGDQYFWEAIEGGIAILPPQIHDYDVTIIGSVEGRSFTWHAVFRRNDILVSKLDGACTRVVSIDWKAAVM